MRSAAETSEVLLRDLLGAQVVGVNVSAGTREWLVSIPRRYSTKLSSDASVPLSAPLDVIVIESMQRMPTETDMEEERENRRCSWEAGTEFATGCHRRVRTGGVPAIAELRRGTEAPQLSSARRVRSRSHVLPQQRVHLCVSRRELHTNHRRTSVQQRGH
jgi:hypothetical protein